MDRQSMATSSALAARMLLSLVLSPCLIVLMGCDSEGLSPPANPSGPQVHRQPIAEQPPVNLPRGLRWKNWTNASGSGSCVIASTCSMVEWQGKHELATFLRRQYAGGQTATSIQQKLAAARVPYIVTESSEVGLLEYATRTRRAAIIWFYPQHCVTFVGFGRGANGQSVAWLLDNNRTDRFIAVPKQDFIRGWRDCGGFGLIALYSPAPPLPY